MAEDLPVGVVQLPIRGFLDSAALMAQCDLVVTADTVTAHLAPALGVPTMICLRHRADWRWGTAGNPTIWYGSAELLFQDARLRWETVLTDAAERVRKLRLED